MYITENDQKEIAKLLKEYIELKNSCNLPNIRSERIMNILFTQYFDKLIHGIIYSGKYRFWRYADVDDLTQEARMAILNSINKEQYDATRGSVFNFFSAVVSKNLINYTRKQSKVNLQNVNIDAIYNNKNIQYTQNYDKNIIMSEVFNVLKACFHGKKRFYQMIELLEHYYELTKGEKFVKKQFIEFAKAYNFSPASVNNLFSYLKRLKLKKEIKDIMEIDYE
jgi:hypothetical protein